MGNVAFVDELIDEIYATETDPEDDEPGEEEAEAEVDPNNMPRPSSPDNMPRP